MLLQNNRFIRGKLHMNFKNKWIIPLLLLVTIGLVGCSNGNNKQGSKASNTQTSQKSQVLSGVYKISDKDSDTDDNGNKQPGYYYFKKNGEVLWAQNETGDEDNGNYGGAARGTWKSLGNNMFEIHIKYIYDNDDFTFKAKKTGNKLVPASSAGEHRRQHRSHRRAVAQTDGSAVCVAQRSEPWIAVRVERSAGSAVRRTHRMT